MICKRKFFAIWSDKIEDLKNSLNHKKFKGGNKIHRLI